MMLKPFSTFLGVCLFSIGVISPAAAQSQYHWSDQFGNKSTLLNGTVIGGVSDLGAVFYNPGRLAQQLRPGFLLTAAAFELNKVDVRVRQGKTNQIEQTNLRGVPSLVAGMFTLPDLPGHRFAYSFLTRRRSESDLFLTVEEREDLLPGFPGDELYIGSWESNSKLDENWVGFTWAHEVTPRVSAGLSTFGTYLGRKKRIDVDARTLTSTGEAALLSRFREYRFRSYGLLWKAGLAADLSPFRLGLSVTTPEITAFGSGSIRYEDFRTPLGPSDGDGPGSEVVVFRETGLKVTTHSPFSVGAGLSWITPRAELHLSGEWFSGVAHYRITGVDSVTSQSSGEVYEYQVVDELDPVLNLGAGIEWQVSDAFSAYGSVISDASAAPDELHLPFEFGSQVSNSTSRADGFHVGAGVSLEARWIDLTAGFTYGATKERMENPLSSRGAEAGHPIPRLREVAVTTRRLRFLLGFTIPLVQEVSDELAPE
jgi:hypothetical protein